MSLAVRCFVFSNAALLIWMLDLNASRLLGDETPKGSSPSFAKEVLPILRANCFGCHQDSKKLGGYLMTDFQTMFKGGEKPES